MSGSDDKMAGGAKLVEYGKHWCPLEEIASTKFSIVHCHFALNH